MRSLSLHRFRNYRRLDISFSEGLNVLRGDNAQGKTNILEAIFLCSAGRSHRTARDADMVMYGERSARVCARIWHPLRGEMEIDIAIERGGGKAIMINGVPLRRMGELLGHLPAVIFSPEDLGVIKNEPQARRRFLDIFISQAKPAYFFDLHQYNKALRQRNALLRQLRAQHAGGAAPFSEGGAPQGRGLDSRFPEGGAPHGWGQPEGAGLLEGWQGGGAHGVLAALDAPVARLGARVMDDRRAFSELIGARAQANHAAVCGGSETLRVAYAPSIKISREDARQDIERKILEALARGADADIARMSTQAGPHKDDLSATLDGKSLKIYGSQGQQRTASLALKMAQVDVMAEESEDMPVLLLDDVMSELDAARQGNLVTRMRATQTFLTGADSRFLREAELRGTPFASPKAVADAPAVASPESGADAPAMQAIAVFVVHGGRVERDK